MNFDWIIPWLLTKALHWLLTKHCVFKKKDKTKLLIYGSLGLIWIHGHPESLALFSAMWPLFSSLLISPISAVGLVPPLFHANCSLHPAGPHSPAGSSSSMFSCQTKSSISNIAGPIFFYGLGAGSTLYRSIGSLGVEKQGLGRYSWL